MERQSLTGTNLITFNEKLSVLDINSIKQLLHIGVVSNRTG